MSKTLTNVKLYTIITQTCKIRRLFLCLLVQFLDGGILTFVNNFIFLISQKMATNKFIFYFDKKEETIINVAISDLEYLYESHEELESDKFESVISGYLYEEIERWVIEDDFMLFYEKGELTDEDIEAAKQVIRDWTDEEIQAAARHIYKKVIADPRFQKIAQKFNTKFYRPLKKYFGRKFYDDLSEIIKNIELSSFLYNEHDDDFLNDYKINIFGSYRNSHRINKNGHILIRIGNWHCTGQQMEAIDNELDIKISRLCKKLLFSCDVVYDSDGYAYLDVYIDRYSNKI